MGKNDRFLPLACTIVAEKTARDPPPPRSMLEIKFRIFGVPKQHDFLASPIGNMERIHSSTLNGGGGGPVERF